MKMYVHSFPAVFKEKKQDGGDWEDRPDHIVAYPEVGAPVLLDKHDTFMGFSVGSFRGKTPLVIEADDALVSQGGRTDEIANVRKPKADEPGVKK